ncbi:GNAT family N-acetyltransferase [Planomicrobium sp. CPCC 101110]|uniref:GNAT family N-acetyltransferase n=1 Tax=Planomicrobium sp. CPCC 101110 TaxID=2599619 RepID=UPI0011B4D11D|nr:GNAT family N-acetyltransferase [Planomicrobium sp. CPCC 101110]TWT26367.1 GNAT family N-acetyltransferase [Planomicrobium sp. CPCC 101110]
MKIRKAVISDAKGIAKVHVDRWKTTYEKILPASYLNGLSYEQREKIWLDNMETDMVFVAENRDGEIVGFSTGGPERSGNYPNHSGELYAIYILEEYQRQGLGKALIRPIVQQLQQENIDGMAVLVLEDNGSRFFYETLGAKEIDGITVKIAGTILNELVYAWDDVRHIPAE